MKMLTATTFILIAIELAAALAPPAPGAPAAPAAPQPQAPAAPAAAIAAPAPWQRLANLPIGVLAAAASRSDATVGSHAAVVVTGGINQTGMTSSLVQVFDTETLSWTTPMRLAAARALHAQVTLPDGRLFVAGGQSGTVTHRLAPLASCELIDLKAGKVELTPPLPGPAAQPTAHVLADGRVVVIGAATASLFDPARGQWAAHIHLHETRQAHASIVLDDNHVLVVGGVNRATLELLDLAGGVSQLLSVRLPWANDDLRVAALGRGRVWVLGGQDSHVGDTTDRTWIVDVSDPAHPTITDGPRLAVSGGLADAVLVPVGPWLVLAGGETQRRGKDTELTVARLLDRRDLSVRALPSLAVQHDDAVAVAVGRTVYVVGGYRLAPSPIPGLPGLPDGGVPSAQRAVERLTLPPDATLEAAPVDPGPPR